MGLILGLDFGTTYSTVSVIENDIVTVCRRGQSYVTEDSLVFKDSDGFLYGSDARESAGQYGTLFEGFKVLLTENNPQKLSNYSSDFESETHPRKITSRYLDHILKLAMSEYTDSKKIDRLVVGIPAVWEDQTTPDEKPNPLNENKSALEDIIRDLGYVDEVILRTEPELACGYYLYNNRVNSGDKNGYSGYLLLIDYGGGTLDIALCRIDASSSNIEIIETFGAGWNRDRQRGDAGLAFFQELTDIATKDEDNDESEKASFRCKLENAIKRLQYDNPEDKKAEKLKTIFESGTIRERAESPLAKDSFAKIKFNGKGIDVTYSMIAEAYVNKIEQVLTAELRKVRKKLDEMEIDYSASSDSFRIQLVGGFSNFLFVQKTVELELKRNPRRDKRFNGGFQRGSDMNFAVSYGAALYANESYTITKKSQFCLGIYGKLGFEPFFAVHVGDKINPGHIYMVMNTENTSPRHFLGNGLNEFAFCSNSIKHDHKDCTKLSVSEKYKRQLSMIVDERYIFGISFDRSSIISLHKWITVDQGQRVYAEYESYSNSTHADDEMFGDIIRETPEKFGLKYLGSERLGNVFQLTGKERNSI